MRKLKQVSGAKKGINEEEKTVQHGQQASANAGARAKILHLRSTLLYDWSRRLFPRIAMLYFRLGEKVGGARSSRQCFCNLLTCGLNDATIKIVCPDTVDLTLHSLHTLFGRSAASVRTCPRSARQAG